MQDFRSLKVWQRSHQLTIAIYRATAGFPRDELFGLRSQVRRSCFSVPSKIAEGCGRGTDADFNRCLQTAMGFASELEYFLILVQDLGYLKPEPCEGLQKEVIEIRRMLNGLIQTVRKGY